MSDSLLIIEDERLLGEELVRHYQRLSFTVDWARTIVEASELLLERESGPLVVLSDLNLPDGNGLDLLEKLREQDINNEWVFLTGYGDVPDSIRAIRLGAYDFLTKPCDQERLDLVINGAMRSARAQRRLQDETVNLSRQYHPGSYVGNSAAAVQVRDMLQKLTGVPFSSLVISGETGTGKGLAARILHHAGPRNKGPMVEVNCAALPHDLLESELFGHEAGAFTGARGRRRGLIEQAHGGTIFLDEIGEMPLDLQSKLLKVIEDRRLRRLGGEGEINVDVQVLAATNRVLESQVNDGSFRSDLYHRLSVFKLALPALRERIDDIGMLVPLFIDEFNVIAGKKVSQVPDSVWKRMRSYHWPGNVRELRNVVERCVLFARDAMFPEEWMQLGIGDQSVQGEVGVDREGQVCLPLDGSMGLDDMVGRIIEEGLRKTGNNVVETSRLLKTTREKIRYRIEKYNIRVSD